MLPLVLLVLCGPLSDFGYARSLNILIYSPTMGRSHTNFMGSLADLLVDAGHTVHVHIPELVPGIETNGTKKAQKIFRQPSRLTDLPILELGLFNDVFSDKDTSMFNSDQFRIILNASLLLCEDLLTNEQLISELRSVPYDVAITEVYDYCSIGIFHMLNISSRVLVSAVPITDLHANIYGLPTPLAYTTNLLSSFVNAPTLTYMERIHNIFIYFKSRHFRLKTIRERESELFRKYVDKDFPDLEQLARSSPALFVNTHPIIEIPRPISPNIFYIGGIAMRHQKPLSKDVEKLLQSGRRGAVLFSLGTITNTNLMPTGMKKGILDAFHQFPDYVFIMKISIADKDKALFANYENVHTFSWVDQINILNHPSVVGFITHAGRNSAIESVFAGKPMICIPLFGDQDYNAATMVNRGVAVYVNKLDINAKTLADALQKILHHKRYMEAAQRLKLKLERFPQDPKGTFVKWVEYVADFPEADLVLEGAAIGFFQYFLLDILIPAFVIAIACIIVIGKLLQLLLRKLRIWLKTKVE